MHFITDIRCDIFLGLRSPASPPATASGGGDSLLSDLDDIFTSAAPSVPQQQVSETSQKLLLFQFLLISVKLEVCLEKTKLRKLVRMIYFEACWVREGSCL